MNSQTIRVPKSYEDSCDKCFYLIGVFTTIQLLSVAGVTVFNITLVLCATVSLIAMMCIRKTRIDVYFILSIASSIVTILLSVCNETLTSGFRRTALVNGFTYLLLLVLYWAMNTRPRSAHSLLRGFRLSCYATLIWCLLQLLCYHFFSIDINAVVFESILKIHGAKGSYYNERLIPTGFYNHRAILTPSLIFLFFAETNPYILLLIIAVGCLTRSTTLIIGIMLAAFFRIIVFFSRNFHYKKISRKILIVLISFVVMMILGLIIEGTKIVDMMSYVFRRISESTSNEAGNSSVVHFLYYINLIPVLQKENLVHFLFGTGFGTSGLHYTLYNGQYVNLDSWVVESDYVNILLSQGVVGLILWVYLLLRLISMSTKKKYWENVAFVLIISFMGILYNMQFHWFIVIEFAIFVLTKNGIRVFEKNTYMNIFLRKEKLNQLCNQL